MKRNLFGNVKVLPCASGTVVDREGFLSAVIAANASADDTLTFTVTESDSADGTFANVADEHVTMGRGVSALPAKKGEALNIDLDLVGCKRFIKVEAVWAKSTTVSCALVLGDPVKTPGES